MALTAMEEPIAFDAESLLDREAEGPQGGEAAGATSAQHTVRGQYAAGWQGGEKVLGYLEEDGIDPQSTTDTYAADQAGGRQPPLGGRPLLPADRQAARAAGHGDRGRLPARPALAVRLDGHRGARRERDRHPGPARRGHDGALRFEGAGHLDGDPGRDDGLRLRRVVHRVQPGGVRTAHPGRPARRRHLFPRHQEVEESWKILDPIEEHWATHGRPAQYASGTWGPKEADEMLARDGRSWRRP